MGTKQKIRPGDILSIPLDENWIATGIVLHVSRKFRNVIFVGYPDAVFNSEPSFTIAELGGTFIWTPNYTSKKVVTEGPWREAGHSQELLEAAEIPEPRVVTTIYYKDTIVRQFDVDQEEEARKYPVLEGQGRIFVENRLRKHFKI